MESDLQFHQMFNEQQQQQKQMNSSGLTRYQSAPSSLFSNLLECEDFFNRPTSPETERIFARFLANDTNFSAQNQGFPAAPPAPEIKQESPARNEEEIAQQAQILASINDDSVLTQQPGFFQSQSKPPLDYRMAGTGRPPPVRGGGTASNLVRHNSSPAGLFSNITIEMENGYAVMRGMGDCNAGQREAANYSSAAMGRMSPISEMGHGNTAENASKNGVFDETRGGDFVSGYPMGSWDDNASSSAISKGLTEDSRTLSGFNAPETQNMESGLPAPPRLAHHLSLPKTAAEMSAIEKFLQDSVPCKIRAKRGFATHPRSIAERVRRTKISERMRKLQELVPNMDKQTNTSEMLDLAVEYIKDLQRQVKTLSDCRANCTCDINVKQEH